MTVKTIHSSAIALTALALIVLALIAPLATGLDAQQSSKTDSPELLNKLNKNLDKLPGIIKSAIGSKTIRVHIELKNGTTDILGVKTEKGQIKEIQKTPYPDSTMALYITEDIIEKISSSDDPASVIQNAWGKEIRCEPLTLGNRIMLFFTDIAFRVYSFFHRPALSAMPVSEPPYSAPREDGFRIDLSRWWQDVPTDREIDIDPVSGALYFFWLDDDGNICHGMPSHSARPGYSVQTPERWTQAIELVDSRITEEQLRAMQIDYYYADDYAGIGPHIFQYKVHVWQSRDSGLVFRDYTGNPSLPIDGSFSFYNVSLATALPVAAMDEQYDCFYRDTLPIPDTDLSEGQHPTKCLRKQDITATDLIQACSEGRLEGSLSEGYFHII
ncbi:MAG: hypothetical protein ABIG84_00730 [archaeon]